MQIVRGFFTRDLSRYRQDPRLAEELAALNELRRRIEQSFTVDASGQVRPVNRWALWDAEQFKKLTALSELNRQHYGGRA